MACVESSGSGALGATANPRSATAPRQELIDALASRQPAACGATAPAPAPRGAVPARTAALRSRKLPLPRVEGTVMTVAGCGERGFRDGCGASARFDGPVGIAALRDGSLLIADMFNNRIRRVW